MKPCRGINARRGRSCWINNENALAFRKRTQSSGALLVSSPVVSFQRVQVRRGVEHVVQVHLRADAKSGDQVNELRQGQPGQVRGLLDGVVPFGICLDGEEDAPLLDQPPDQVGFFELRFLGEFPDHFLDALSGSHRYDVSHYYYLVFPILSYS